MYHYYYLYKYLLEILCCIFYYDGCNTEERKIGKNDGKCKTSSLMLIPPLECPRHDGSNGGQIIHLSIYYTILLESLHIKAGLMVVLL